MIKQNDVPHLEHKAQMVDHVRVFQLANTAYSCWSLKLLFFHVRIQVLTYASHTASQVPSPTHVSKSQHQGKVPTCDP